MGAKSKRKGRAGELELTALLNELGYTTVRAGACTSYGHEPDISGLRGIHVECKRVERLNLEDAMRQSVDDAAKFHDGRPAVFHRRNGKTWLVTMRLEDWARMYGAAIGQPPKSPTGRARTPQGARYRKTGVGTPKEKTAITGQEKGEIQQ